MAMPSTHESLIQRLSSGDDPEAWQVFQDRYGALLRDYGRRRGMQPSDCDDLLQDVLLSLTRSMPRFRYDPTKGTLRGYLKTVALRAISKRLGQKQGAVRLEDVGEPEVADDEQWEAAWRAYHVRRALDGLASELPASSLAAFRMYVLEETSAAETARRLKLSIDSVYQAKSRILRRLSDRIGEQIAEEG